MATTRRLFLSAALIASGLGIGTGFAPTANACGPGGDLNVLCPMEQKYVDDLAAIERQFHHLLRTVPSSARTSTDEVLPP